jgi:AcrR family transcriptional regulator
MSNVKVSQRRTPSQQRGERRLRQLLDAAEDVFAEVGCEAATMTEIAERAEASIGAVYQYFPNKDAMIIAVRRRHAGEIEVRWAPLLAEELSIKELVERIFDEVIEYIEKRPAYIAVMSAIPNYKREPAVRNKMREEFATMFRKRRPEMSREAAFRVANVMMSVLRGMNTLYAEAKNAKEREEVVREFKMILVEYLNSRLMDQD